MLHRWFGTRPPAWQVVAVIGLTLASPLMYLALPRGTFLWYFDVTPSVRDHQRIRAGEQGPVVRIADLYDVDAMSHRASSLHPYEPLFGYYLETFKPAIHVGDIDEEQDGWFNMTNPASLVFPELNGLQPFDRIRASDRQSLERFASRQQPDWRVPPLFRWLNLIALAALAMCVGLPLVETIKRASRRCRP